MITEGQKVIWKRRVGETELCGPYFENVEVTVWKIIGDYATIQFDDGDRYVVGTYNLREITDKTVFKNVIAELEECIKNLTVCGTEELTIKEFKQAVEVLKNMKV